VGAVALLKAYVEELVGAWEEDVERVMQDAVGDYEVPSRPGAVLLSRSPSDWL